VKEIIDIGTGREEDGHDPVSSTYRAPSNSKGLQERVRDVKLQLTRGTPGTNDGHTDY